MRTHRTSPRAATTVTVVLALLWGVLTAVLVPSPHAAAATTPARTHTVTMGAVDPSLPDATPRPPATAGRTDRFEYLAYYPDTVRVHRGDTVHFRRDGFHTVTFSAPGERRSGWVRRDEAEGTSAEGSAAPSHPTCGSADQPACVVSSKTRSLNSGWQDLRVKVDLPVGTYSYYCLLHAGMEGAVEVVPTTTPLPPPRAVEAARRAQVATDTAAGAALLDASQEPRATPVDGRMRWTVKAGDITPDGRVAILRFLPSNLQVAPGDEVAFVVPGERVPPGRAEASTEVHTVTFPNDPSAQGFGMLRYFDPRCDADGPTEGRPGAPATHASLVTGCPPGTTAELVFHPWAWRSPLRARGDAVTTPVTAHDSGLLVPWRAACRTSCDPWSGKRFASRSVAVFPNEGTFGYICLVHPEMGMAGAVTVREP